LGRRQSLNFRVQEHEEQHVHRSLPDLAYSQIRAGILSGRLPFDSALNQVEVAELLGMSRLPVREALRKLDAEGFVVLKPRRGYYVAPYDIEEMEDALEIQMLLEERVGFIAATKRTESDVRKLQAVLLDLDEIASKARPDAERYTRKNSEFHDTLFGFSRREYLLKVLRNVSQNVEKYTRFAVSLAEDMSVTKGEHHDIFEAFKKGDGKRVAHFCRIHREKGKQRLIARIKILQSAKKSLVEAAKTTKR
jgi:DNA-binding GntR family transcriptional regulator